MFDAKRLEVQFERVALFGMRLGFRRGLFVLDGHAARASAPGRRVLVMMRLGFRRRLFVFDSIRLKLRSGRGVLVMMRFGFWCRLLVFDSLWIEIRRGRGVPGIVRFRLRGLCVSLAVRVGVVAPSDRDVGQIERQLVGNREGGHDLPGAGPRLRGRQRLGQRQGEIVTRLVRERALLRIGVDGEQERVQVVLRLGVAARVQEESRLGELGRDAPLRKRLVGHHLAIESDRFFRVAERLLTQCDAVLERPAQDAVAVLQGLAIGDESLFVASLAEALVAGFEVFAVSTLVQRNGPGHDFFGGLLLRFVRLRLGPKDPADAESDAEEHGDDRDRDDESPATGPLGSLGRRRGLGGRRIGGHVSPIGTGAART